MQNQLEQSQQLGSQGLQEMSQAILLCAICVLPNLDHNPETLCYAVFVYSIEKAFEIRKMANSHGESYASRVDHIGQEVLQKVKNLNQNLPVFFNDIVKAVKRSLEIFEEMSIDKSLLHL